MGMSLDQKHRHREKIFTFSTFVRLPALLYFVSATLALAHEDATGVVKEGMDLMKRQRKDMKLIGDMAKGKTPLATPPTQLMKPHRRTTIALLS